MVAFLGISLVALCLIVIRADDPETAYDESETPVTLAIPIALATAVNRQLILNSGRSTNVRVHAHKRIPCRVAKTQRLRAPQICLELLCTLLC
jgi:hypothetical protein